MIFYKYYILLEKNSNIIIWKKKLKSKAKLKNVKFNKFLLVIIHKVIKDIKFLLFNKKKL